MKTRVYSGFSNMTPNALLTLGSKVFDRMTVNSPMYSDFLNGEVVKLGPMCTQLRLLIDKASSRDSMAISERKNYVPEFRHQLKVIANNLNLNYRGNDKALEGTGFMVMKSPKSHPMTSIRNLVITTSSQEGYIRVRVVGAKNYKSLKVYIGTDMQLSEETTEVFDSTLKTFEKGKYAFGTQLFIKVVALGKDDSTETSRVHPFTVTYPAGRKSVGK